MSTLKDNSEKMKVLLAGFEPFSNLEINPSQIIVEEIAERMRLSSEMEITAIVLPTEFEASGRRIEKLIRTIQPVLVLLLGVAVKSNVLNLERVALNLDDTQEPDNAGEYRKGSLIVKDGPLAYFSNIPLEYLEQQLNKSGMPTIISNYAGSYVCNHVFYLAQHEIEKLGINSLCGFIHVPYVSSQSSNIGTKFKITLIDLVEAILYVLNLLKEIIKA